MMGGDLLELLLELSELSKLAATIFGGPRVI